MLPPDARARSLLRAPSGNSAAEFTYKDAPLFAEARAISKFAQEMFLKGEVDAVDILFTHFINTLTQKPEVLPLLPIGELQSAVTCRVARNTRPQALEEAPARVHFRAGRRNRCWVRCCRTT